VGSEMDASRDTQALPQEGTDGELEVKEEFRGEGDRPGDGRKKPGEVDPIIGIAVQGLPLLFPKNLVMLRPMNLPRQERGNDKQRHNSTSR